MTTDEDSVGTGDIGEVGLKKVTNVYFYAWGSHLVAVLEQDVLAFLSYLERDNMEMGKL